MAPTIMEDDAVINTLSDSGNRQSCVTSHAKEELPPNMKDSEALL